jgi:hypothetical protein
MSSTPPAVTHLREEIRQPMAWQFMVGCHTPGLSGYALYEVNPDHYSRLWVLWRSSLPLYGHPEEPPPVRTKAEGWRALNSLLCKLDELFGPVSASESSEMVGACVVDHGPQNVQAAIIVPERTRDLADKPSDPTAMNGASSETPHGPRFGTWAFGYEIKNRWHIFKKVRGDWQHQGVLRNLSTGLQTQLMEGFAEGGGFLALRDAIETERPNCPAGERQRVKNNIFPGLTRLRKVLRAAMNLENSNPDPLPYFDDPAGWRAEVEIGYAVEEDCSSTGGKKRLRFKNKEQL